MLNLNSHRTITPARLYVAATVLWGVAVGHFAINDHHHESSLLIGAAATTTVVAALHERREDQREVVKMAFWAGTVHRDNAS